MARVYLAGGFSSDWRKLVITHHELIDPKQKEESGEWNLQTIGTWDKFAIKTSDIVFAYIDRQNPSGFGTSCEIGYACALGKTVILVLEEEHKIHKDEYLDFLKNFADCVFETFESGLSYLNTLP